MSSLVRRMAFAGDEKRSSGGICATGRVDLASDLGDAEHCEVGARHNEQHRAEERPDAPGSNRDNRRCDRCQREGTRAWTADLVGNIEEPVDFGTLRGAGCVRLLHAPNSCSADLRSSAGS